MVYINRFIVNHFFYIGRFNLSLADFIIIPQFGIRKRKKENSRPLKSI